MVVHDIYIYRCLELAKYGAGNVAPNPMVGAVLVHNNRIIGEGWHKEYGKAHAEVNCLDSVKEEDRDLIPESVLYVSLEPCVHHGKTPPCADLIIAHKIPNVIIGCLDPFDAVKGKGADKLRKAGIEVAITEGRLNQHCIDINKRFFTYHLKKRPYIILKWAQTNDGFIALNTVPVEGPGEARLIISNAYTNRLVHRWRSEEAAILVGANTALKDNPELNNRFWTGPSPLRLVIDHNLRLPSTLKLFNGQRSTIIFNNIKHTVPHGMSASMTKNQHAYWYYKIDNSGNAVREIINALYDLQVQSILVEGGAALLNSFIRAGEWDEIRRITNEAMSAGEGLHMEMPSTARLADSFKIGTDRIETWRSIMTE